jgi:hypothetical protein
VSLVNAKQIAHEDKRRKRIRTVTSWYCVKKPKKIKRNLRAQLFNLHLRNSCSRSSRQWREHFEQGEGAVEARAGADEAINYYYY